MVPSTQIEVLPEPEAEKKRFEETLVLEPRKASSGPPPLTVKPAHMPEEGSLQSSLLEYNRMKSGS